MTRRFSTGLAGAVLALLGGALAAAPAAASEQIQIREVAPGSQYGATAEFVELQMTADGQQNLDGRQIIFIGADGSITTEVLSGGVSNGSSQRTVLIGTGQLSTINGVEPDYTYDEPRLSGTSGAVCYSDVDCVGWGAFATTEKTGAPGPAITDGRSITRTIARGCSTALDSADDTDDSAADFSLTDVSPRNNATAPTETVCGSGGGGSGGGGSGTAPDTSITKAPKAKIKLKAIPKDASKKQKRKLKKKNKRKSKAKFKFTSDTENVKFECKLDRKPWLPCDSPLKIKKVKKGKHTFKVRAITASGATDKSPAKHKWKIKKGKRK